MDILNDMRLQIEILREQMIKIAEVNGRNHELSIEVSRELDRLLNSYEVVKRQQLRK